MIFQIAKRFFISAALFISFPLVVQAAQPFEATAFAAAQDAGKSVLIDVTAPWCPTCKIQKSVIDKLEAEQANLTVFDVDFDSSNELLGQLGVKVQSTLIMYKGKVEVARSAGQTDPQMIHALVAKGL